MEDLNGTISYSRVITLNYENLDQLAANPVSLYPNPTKSMINLTINSISANGSKNSPGLAVNEKSNSTANSNYNIKIMNSSGLIIRSELTRSTTWQTDVKNPLPGTYVMQVYDASNNSLVGKGTFVKM
jgi:hypothetical protein